METKKQQTKVTFTEIKEISRRQLVDLFFKIELKGTNFVQVLTKTTPNMNKTDNPFYQKSDKTFLVHKISDTNCQIGWWYDNAVNNRRQKEGNTAVFEQKARTWGQHMVNPINYKVSKIMIDHKNKQGQYKQYAQLRTLDVKATEYRYNLTNNPLDGQALSLLNNFLVKRQKTKTQNLEQDIIVSDYNLDNILQITINKVKYIVR